MNAPFRIELPRSGDRPNRAVRARFTVDDYYRMSELGILDRLGRTELIDGGIIVLNAHYIGHARIHDAIHSALKEAIKRSVGELEALFEATTELSAHDGPLPDITIFDSSKITDTQRGIPRDAVRLIVEVANSSARRDLGKKRKLYASRGVPEYWVAVLKTATIERFADPVDGDYQKHDSFAFADAVDSVTLPGVGIAAGTLTT
jgi:Uma2 family endonuclease